ncbi:hypothetical protein AB0B66_09415 [Catellatospora sp. NPDC049111]|uniref:hypothetical protein n=1 Tax=Catellatospora sp. NPDC049111 TaxID=3155271 RepID=UPI0033F307F7
MRQLNADLPLRFERTFQPWMYAASHRTLVLRSHGRADPGHESAEFEEAVDVMFVGVIAMNTRFHYRPLLIAAVGDLTEVEGFPEVPERHRAGFVYLSVSDGTHDGFVVCGNLQVGTTGELGLRWSARIPS